MAGCSLAHAVIKLVAAVFTGLQSWVGKDVQGSVPGALWYIYRAMPSYFGLVALISFCSVLQFRQNEIHSLADRHGVEFCRISADFATS